MHGHGLGAGAPSQALGKDRGTKDLTAFHVQIWAFAAMVCIGEFSALGHELAQALPDRGTAERCDRPALHVHDVHGVAKHWNGRPSQDGLACDAGCGRDVGARGAGLDRAMGSTDEVNGGFVTCSSSGSDVVNQG